jgi:hypothetical protein
MKKICSTITLLFFAVNTFSQNSFQRLIGGPQHERSQTVYSTGDGGYMVNAASGSFGAGDIDMMLIKLDVSGNILWSNTYNTGEYDNAEFSIQTSDQKYVCAGRSNINGGSFPTSAIIYKTDSAGNLLFSKRYGGTGNDGFVHIIETSDNGFAAVGNTQSLSAGGSDILLVRTDLNGDTIFTRSYGTAENESGSYVIQLPDNGFLIAGRQATVNGTRGDGILLRTDSAGNQLWSKMYGDTLFEELTSVQHTSDGGFIVSGSTTGNGSGGFDILLMKTDSGGAVTWSQAYGGAASDAAYDVHITSDNGFLVSGFTESLGYGHRLSQGADESNIFLLKTNDTGAVQWMEVYGDGLQDEAFRSAIASDGGYLVGGFTTNYLTSDSSQIIIIKTDSMGISGCHESQVMPADSIFTIASRDTLFQQQSGIPIANFSLQLTPVVPANDDACLFSQVNSVDKENYFEIYPNPFNDILHIRTGSGKSTVRILDTLGKECMRISDAVETVNVNTANLSSGIYFITISNEKIRESKIIVLSR